MMLNKKFKIWFFFIIYITFYYSINCQEDNNNEGNIITEKEEIFNNLNENQEEEKNEEKTSIENNENQNHNIRENKEEEKNKEKTIEEQIISIENNENQNDNIRENKEEEMQANVNESQNENIRENKEEEEKQENNEEINKEEQNTEKLKDENEKIKEKIEITKDEISQGINSNDTIIERGNENINNLDNKKNEENVVHNIYNTEKEQNNKFKILFENYLLSFHNQLLKYLPIPYDYIFMFILGYLFMSLFTKPKNRIYIKQKKKLVDINIFQIEQNIREISNLQEKLNEKKNAGDGKQIQKNENLNYSPKEKIDLEKLEQIESKINKLMEDLCERNKENSVEKSLQNNICDLQTKILEEVNKQNEDDEGEEEEDDEKGEKKLIKSEL
jgi:hypothetical protein